MHLNHSQLKYCPFYCEENIWHLCQEDSLLPFDRKVLFISNPKQCITMMKQKAGSPVYWDYHVVLLFRDDGWKIADLDTLLSFPCPTEEYLSKSFAPNNPPLFRIIDVTDFVKHFKSDRRHMIDHNGKFLQPPPPWDTVGKGEFTLWDFIDFEQTEHGQLYNLNEMYARFT